MRCFSLMGRLAGCTAAVFAVLGPVAWAQTAEQEKPPEKTAEKVPDAAPEGTISLKLIPSGMAARLGGYVPHRIALSAAKPDNLKKAPVDFSKGVRYGFLRYGSKEKPIDVLVALDEPDRKLARLLVDANANGDLTDDAPVEWKASEYKKRGEVGKELTLALHRGTAQLPLAFGGATTPVAFEFYRFDPNDPARAQSKDTLFYYRDWGFEGAASLAGVSRSIALDDVDAGADYAKLSRFALLVDANGDNKWDARGERFRADKPFRLGETTYVAQSVDPIKGQLVLAQSKQIIAPLATPPDLSVGKSAPEFTAQVMDGEQIEFPQGFAGKVVLLHFWATWNEASIADVPTLLMLYDKHRTKGLGILGIILDKPGNGTKLSALVKERNMAWLHVYDGKYWDATLARLYNVNTLPAAFLVDGDTGLILASGDELRGENLAKNVETALAAKNRTKSDANQDSKERNEVKSVPPVVPETGGRKP